MHNQASTKKIWCKNDANMNHRIGGITILAAIPQYKVCCKDGTRRGHTLTSYACDVKYSCLISYTIWKY